MQDITKFFGHHTHVHDLIRKLKICHLFKHAQRRGQIGHTRTRNGAYWVDDTLHSIISGTALLCQVMYHIRDIISTHWGSVICVSKLTLVIDIDGWGIYCEITFRWILQNTFDDKLTLVQVMAWCSQATNHYLCWCWSKYMSPYDVSRPQWMNLPTYQPVNQYFGHWKQSV